jgi:hypothetical protein
MRKIFCIAVLLAMVSETFAQWTNLNAGMWYRQPPYRTVHYGRWDVRAKICQDPGVVSCFVMITAEEIRNADGSKWNELDIEMVGNDNHIECVAHVQGIGSGKNPYYYYPAPSAIPLQNEYHLWTVVFCPDSVCWMLDGHTYRRVVPGTTSNIHEDRYIVGDPNSTPTTVDYDFDWIAAYSEELLSYQFDIWVNSGVFGFGDSYNGSISCGGHSSMFMSYFRYYDWTPGEGPGGSDFTLVDYDSYEGDVLSSERWGGYVGSEAYRTIVRDGYAISTINCNGEWGYNGEIPYDAEDLTSEQLEDEKQGITFTKEQAKRGADKNISLDYSNGIARCNLKTSARVRINLFDLGGRHIRTVANKDMSAGRHSFSIDERSIPAGTYLLTMHGPFSRISERVVVGGK